MICLMIDVIGILLRNPESRLAPHEREKFTAGRLGTSGVMTSQGAQLGDEALVTPAPRLPLS